MCALNPPQDNLREVIRRAFDEIGDVDPPLIARNAGGCPRGDARAVRIAVLGRPVTLDVDSRCVRDAEGVVLADHVAAPIARYVARSGELRSSVGHLVGFADVPDARGYELPFRGRVVAPLLAVFGRDPAAFERAAAEWAGTRDEDAEAAGGLAFRFPVFPRISLVFVLDPADEELPAGGQVLFPPEVFDAYAVDDAVVMAGLVSGALRGKLSLPRGGVDCRNAGG
jgi:hypothetical protein